MGRRCSEVADRTRNGCKQNPNCLCHNSLTIRSQYDPSKIHRFDYQGKYLKFSGFHQPHPSPQRTPYLFQAGASKAGIDFGGKHAEAIFCAHATIAKCKEYTTEVRAAAVRQGRDPSSIEFFLGAMLFLGKTEEEAQEKFETARKLVSIEGMSCI